MQPDTNMLPTVFRFVGFSLFFLLSILVLVSNNFFLSSIPHTKKVKPPNKLACDKLAVTMSTYNEEYTIEESINSIAPYVGEVVVIEHGSTDSTPQILKKLMQKYPNIQVKNTGSNIPFSDSSNLGYMVSTRPWILPWAGDYFFYPGAQKKICSLIDKYEKENIQIINFSIPRIDGDINHVYSSKVNGELPEERLFKRGAIMTRQTSKFVDGKIIPLKMQHSTTSNQFFQIHVASFKSAERLYYSEHMKPYLIYASFEIANVRKPLPFWDWEYCRLHNINNTQNADVAAFKKKRMEEFCKEQVLPFSEFDSDKWGPIPNYLKRMSFFKKFGLKYVKKDENGNKLYQRILPGCPK